MSQVILSYRFTSLKKFLLPSNPYDGRIYEPWELDLIFGSTLSQEVFVCISYHNNLEGIKLEKGNITYMYLNKNLSKYSKLFEDKSISAQSAYLTRKPTEDGARLLKEFSEKINDTREYWS